MREELEEQSLVGSGDCRGARAAVRVIERHVNLNLVACWISPSVRVACPLTAFGGSISPWYTQLLGIYLYL